MKKIFLAPAFFACITLCQAESSTNGNKFYARGDVGIGIPGHTMNEANGYPQDNIKGSNSFQYSVGGGFYATSNIRMDLLFSQITNLKYNFNFLGSSGTLSDGKQRIKVDTLMLSGYYDLVTNSSFKPYIGIGLGLANIQPSNLSVINPQTNNGFIFYMDKSRKLAISGIFGVSFPIQDKFSLDLNYKYLYLGKGKALKEMASSSNGTIGTRQKTGAGVKYKLDTHNVSVGLRYSF